VSRKHLDGYLTGDWPEQPGYGGVSLSEGLKAVRRSVDVVMKAKHVVAIVRRTPSSTAFTTSTSSASSSSGDAPRLLRVPRRRRFHDGARLEARLEYLQCHLL
jgi:hypothetical protein